MSSELIERLRLILDGIDRTEVDYDDGWWATSSGEDFGAGKLAEVEALFTALQAELAEAQERISELIATAIESRDWSK